MIPISYDALIITTGSPYTHPIKPNSLSLTLKDRLLDIQSYINELKTINSIIVIGGGLVGVELAGEIISRIPGIYYHIIFFNNFIILYQY